ncbi:unnamed protein product [Effrenium voratum]|uniref:NADH:flavin oxidoreductase/NADH oxidase N-terminal domain-containing protein n=1 Tax=Effrenium voratum TaxID=2562239 RepID=A0AA36HSW7_9DINO|nr:unnamed protein product [Effrenium voratum]CAJ1373884.1 unnamed protein product [Effrenium voratum]CAJ1440840.1 unnamed protein product [Effrenium voratum]
MADTLFQPLVLGGGALRLKHRVVLAPLTRTRASEADMAPQSMCAEYYQQRASEGGLLISEATNISMESCGYHRAPGIWSEAQVSAWRCVTDKVHDKGGYIFCQLWHIGRVSHPSWSQHPLLAAAKASGAPMPSVSASEVAMPGKTYNVYPEGSKGPNAAPRALETAELPRLVADYRHAARCAMRAGFDGVEVHAAHGYLLDQFLRTGTNHRTDRYGGSVENRSRLLLEVVAAVLEEVGVGRVAVRLSPTQPGAFDFFGAGDENHMDADGCNVTYRYVVEQLNAKPLAYLLLTEPRWTGGRQDNDAEKDPGFNMPITNSSTYRKIYKGVLMAAGGFVPSTAAEAVAAGGCCDLVAFGRWFLANPDLPKRIQAGAPLNHYRRATFYTHEEEGYVDYPDLAGSVGQAGKYALIDASALVAPKAKL